MREYLTFKGMMKEVLILLVIVVVLALIVLTFQGG